MPSRGPAARQHGYPTNPAAADGGNSGQQTVTVTLPHHQYPIIIGPGVLSHFGEILTTHTARTRVTILADASEPAEEIDIARAEAARTRAEERVRRYREQNIRDIDIARASAALQRSLVRLNVAHRRRRPGPPRV